MSETEQIIYLVDIQIPGIDEKAQSVGKLRAELEGLGKTQSDQANASAQSTAATQASTQAVNAFGETAAQVEARLNSLGQATTQQAAATTALADETTQATTTMARDWGSIAAAYAEYAQEAEADTKKTVEAQGQLQDSQDKTKKSTKELGEEQRAHSELTKAANEATKQWSDSLIEISGTRLPGLTNAVGNASGALVGLATGSMAEVAVFAAMGLAATGLTAALVVEGAEWQHLETSIATAADISVEKAHEIGTAFLAMDLPQSAMEIGQAYEAVAGRLTVYNGEALSAGQATDLMRVASDGAVASGQDLVGVTDALVKSIMSSHSSIEDAEAVMNALYITSRNTGMSMEQVAMMAGRLSGRMGDAAPDIAGVGLALSMVTEAGISGQRAMMPVMTLMENLAYPTEKARTDLDALGVTIVKNADGSMDFAASMQSLKAGYDSLSTATEKHALAEELGGKNAGILESMLKLTDAQMATLVGTYENHSRVSDDAAKHTHDLEESMQRLGTAAHNASMEIGGGLAAAIMNVADAGAKFGKAIDDLPDSAKMVLGILPMAVPGVGMLGAAALYMGKESADKERERLGSSYVSEADQARQLANQAHVLNRAPSEPKAPPMVDLEDIKNQTEFNAALGKTGETLHSVMTSVSEGRKTFSEDQAAAKSVSDAIEDQAVALEKAYGPAAQEKVSKLRTLRDDYVKSLNSTSVAERQSAQAALDSYEIQLTAGARSEAQSKKAAEEAKKAATEQARQAAEAKRAAHEAAQADVGTGLALSMSKGLEGADLRKDLQPAAAKVMDDFMAAMAAQGTSGAAGAGKSLGDAIVGLTEKMRTENIGDWQETLGQMFDVADAIRRNEPGAVEAFHDLVSHVSQELEDATIAKAVAKATVEADLKAEEAHTSLLDKQAAADQAYATSREASLQGEMDRQYDIWATEQIRELDLKDKYAEQDKATQEKREREDGDRAEQQLREKTDREEKAGRALADLGVKQSESGADLSRRRQREDADSEHQHQIRMEAIKKAGGPDVAKKLADEEASFQSTKKETARSRGEDDAETRVKNQEAVGQLQRQQAEAAADAEKKAKEANDDLVKKRTREDAARAEERRHEEELNGPSGLKMQHQQMYHEDAESKARQRQADEIARIDARWQHEFDKSDEGEARAQAAREHTIALAGLNKNAPDYQDQVDAENQRYSGVLTGITQDARAKSGAVDQTLSAAIAANRPKGPTTGGNPPSMYSMMEAQAPRATDGGGTASGAQRGANGAGGAGSGSGGPQIVIQIDLKDAVIASDQAIGMLTDQIMQKATQQLRGRVMVGSTAPF